MDILRNIEKKILNIANNNTNNASEINNLKKDIKLYLDVFEKREEINRKKKEIYDELYENKRKAYSISYINYLSDKKDLMKDIEKEKTKGAIRKYLECKYEDEEHIANIPNIYTYENIRLPNSHGDFVIPSVPPNVLVNIPINNKKVQKPVKPSGPSKLNVKECPEGKEINPITKRCVNICKDGQVRNPETGKCVGKDKKAVYKKKENKEDKEDKKDKKDKKEEEPKEKECPEGKEINPLTKRCVNVCKEGQKRNPETGKCVTVKKK